MKTFYHKNKALGHLLEWQQTAHTIHLSISNAKGLIHILNDGLVRICLWQDQQENTVNPYATLIKENAIEASFKVVEVEEALIVQTALLDLEIQKNPLRFTFKTKDGQLINTDDRAFGTSWLGNEVTTYKTLLEGERFIGLGEKTGPLDRRGNAYENWNTDYFAYPTDGDPLYATIPFYIGIHDQLCYGIFFDNTYRTTFNFGASNHRFSYFSAPDGMMDYYFIYGNTIPDILKAYAQLTGTMPLPPKWSLGYQQCRYSYYPDKEVLNLAQQFRDRQIPADVIYLDIHYMEAYKAFTFDKERFPTPKELVATLQDKGFRTAVIIDPGIKVEKNYLPYDSAIDQGLFVQYPDGEAYTADVWPGTCHFPDFTDPKCREWWGEMCQFYTDLGIEGFWNDMNEPASWGQCTPNLIEFDFEGQGANHQRARNVYGMQMARATFEGTKARLDGKRPFVLTRAAYAGIQRFAALWTGDNTASDEHMLAGVKLLNSLGLSGVAYSGYDMGGFAGEASSDLFSRWMSIAAFSPFFRGHSMINSQSAEPWTFGEGAEDIARNYINLRYRLLPYLYSTFYEASQTGMPVVRSLAIDHPHEAMIYQSLYEHQYLFGHAILVAPVVSHQAISKVYLPEGNWYDLYNDCFCIGGHEICIDTPPERLPLFVKAGGIIPMQSLIQHHKELPDTTLELHVYAGANGDFVYYEDDGETYAYEAGAFLRQQINYDDAQKTLQFHPAEGDYTSHFETIRIYLHGFKDINTNHTTAQMTYHFVHPISRFDPFFMEEEVLKDAVKDLWYIEVPFKADGQILNFAL